jgi:hypothetical protein
VHRIVQSGSLGQEPEDAVSEVLAAICHALLAVVAAALGTSSPPV